MHGSDRKDARSGIAHGIGRPNPSGLHVRDLQLQDARDDLQAVLDAVVDLLQQELLLLHERLQRALGLLELAPLIQLAKFGKLREEPHAHLTPRRLRVLQQQSRQLLVDPQKLARVFFEFEAPGGAPSSSARCG